MNSIKIQDSRPINKNQFLDISNEYSEMKFKNQFHLWVYRNKWYLEIDLTTVYDLYTENCKTTLKEIKLDLKKMKRYPVFMNWKT